MATIPEKIRSVVEQLSPDYQQIVLAFAEGLIQAHHVSPSSRTSLLPVGTPGKALLGFKLPLEDIEAMEQALEDCEEVEQDES